MGIGVWSGGTLDLIARFEGLGCGRRVRRRGLLRLRIRGR